MNQSLSELASGVVTGAERKAERRAVAKELTGETSGGGWLGPSLRVPSLLLVFLLWCGSCEALEGVVVPFGEFASEGDAEPADLARSLPV